MKTKQKVNIFPFPLILETIQNIGMEVCHWSMEAAEGLINIIIEIKKMRGGCMKNLSQLANEFNLDEHIKKLKKTIDDLPEQMSKKIRLKEITLINWDNVHSLPIMDT